MSINNYSQGEFLRQTPANFFRGSGFFRNLNVDGILLLLLLILLSLSLFILYSAANQSEQYFWNQLRYIGLGLLVMTVVAQISLRFWQEWGWMFYVLGIILLILVLLFGDSSKGAQRWLNLGGLRFQPSELMKIALPMAVAAYLSRHHLPPTNKHLFVALLMLALPLVMIGLQPDLGSAILIAFSGFVVIFVAGLPWLYIILALISMIVSTPLIWNLVLHDYQRGRILTLLNPAADKLGAGWNIIQSKTAIGSGGWSGKGWLQGTQSQLDFLPEGHTDFIIAVLAEEFGLRGVLILLSIYMLVILRGLWISFTAPLLFGRLLAAALVMTFFIYVFVNVGMVSGILPIVGVPLPLISYGGTSMLTLLTGFGILMAIAKQR